MKAADLRKVMLKNGWIERRYPSGKGLMTVYERKKSIIRNLILYGLVRPALAIPELIIF